MFILTKYNKSPEHLGGHDVNSRPIGEQPEKEREEEEEEEDEVKVQEENLLLNHVQQVRKKKKSLKDCEQSFLVFRNHHSTVAADFYVKMDTGILEHIKQIPVSEWTVVPTNINLSVLSHYIH